MTPYESVKAATLVAFLFVAAIIGARLADAVQTVSDSAAHVGRVADRAEADAHQATEQLVGTTDTRLEQAIRMLDQTRSDADARTAEALTIVRTATETADRRLESIEDNISSQLGTTNHTLALAADRLAGPQGSVTLTLQRYQMIPDQLAGNPIVRAYEAQGLGTLAATKIFMGDAAKAGRTFDAQFPALLSNFDATTLNFAGVSADVHTFTSRAVAPRGFWGNVKDVLATGSGVARAAGAAGLF